MPSPKTIAEIKLNLLRPALTSHFEVKIPKPPYGTSAGGFGQYLISNGVKYNQDKLNLLCSDALLPGSQLATHSITGDFHGATHKHAYRRQFDDRIDLSFYVDVENYLPIRYFESWIKYVAGEQITTTEGGRPGTQKSEYFYRMNYPKHYISNSGFQVIKFERDYKQSMIYNFVDVFPISVNSMTVSYDASSLLKCTVGFSYVRYFLTPTTLSASGKDPSSATGEKSKLTPANSAQFNTDQFKGNGNDTFDTSKTPGLNNFVETQEQYYNRIYGEA